MKISISYEVDKHHIKRAVLVFVTLETYMTVSNAAHYLNELTRKIALAKTRSMLRCYGENYPTAMYCWEKSKHSTEDQVRIEQQIHNVVSTLFPEL